MDIFDRKKFRNILSQKDSVYRNSREAGYEIKRQGMNIHSRIDFVVTSHLEVAWVAKYLENASRDLFAIDKEFKRLRKPNKFEKVKAIVKSKFVLEHLREDLKARVSYKRAKNLSTVFRSDNQQININ